MILHHGPFVEKRERRKNKIKTYLPGLMWGFYEKVLLQTMKHYVAATNNKESETHFSHFWARKGQWRVQSQVSAFSYIREFHFLEVWICHMHHRPTSMYPEHLRQGEGLGWEPVWIGWCGSKNNWLLQSLRGSWRPKAIIISVLKPTGGPLSAKE